MRRKKKLNKSFKNSKEIMAADLESLNLVAPNQKPIHSKPSKPVEKDPIIMD